MRDVDIYELIVEKFPEVRVVMAYYGVVGYELDFKDYGHEDYISGEYIDISIKHQSGDCLSFYCELEIGDKENYLDVCAIDGTVDVRYLSEFVADKLLKTMEKEEISILSSDLLNTSENFIRVQYVINYLESILKPR